MHNLVRRLQRVNCGVWSCIEPATLDQPEGRIKVTPGSTFTLGTTFMKADVAKLPEERHAREKH